MARVNVQRGWTVMVMIMKDGDVDIGGGGSGNCECSGRRADVVGRFVGVVGGGGEKR